MELDSNTVLVTGGASGIGLALAERFLRAGSRVVVCGRRASQLEAARERHPGLDTYVCDLTGAAAREALVEWATRTHPGLNVVVNNAGIQRRVALTENEPWEATEQEIAINLEAPIHLSRLFVPHLRRQPRAAIVNVTSGLAFAPLAATPVYSATKAALHSFTLSLRHQLAGTPIQVIEIAPPAVNTDLGGPGLHTFGVPVDEFADAAMARVAAGELEVAHGFAAQSSRASRQELDEIFRRMNSRA
ncbi:MAG: SDR family oxidoreductase [Betaproteobacteria bacterium]